MSKEMLYIFFNAALFLHTHGLLIEKSYILGLHCLDLIPEFTIS